MFLDYYFLNQILLHAEERRLHLLSVFKNGKYLSLLNSMCEILCFLGNHLWLLYSSFSLDIEICNLKNYRLILKLLYLYYRICNLSCCCCCVSDSLVCLNRHWKKMDITSALLNCFSIYIFLPLPLFEQHSAQPL